MGRDERAPGGFELSVRNLEVVSLPQGEYPIGPKEHGIDFLMDPPPGGSPAPRGGPGSHPPGPQARASPRGLHRRWGLLHRGG
ncbi:hypothetical protein CSW35_02735 [Thermus scotoductus]|nr:hypothetical protein CSW35_02735 [Thermus scotoductus]